MNWLNRFFRWHYNLIHPYNNLIFPKIFFLLLISFFKKIVTITCKIFPQHWNCRMYTRQKRKIADLKSTTTTSSKRIKRSISNLQTILGDEIAISVDDSLKKQISNCKNRTIQTSKLQKKSVCHCAFSQKLNDYMMTSVGLPIEYLRDDDDESKCENTCQK